MRLTHAFTILMLVSAPASAKDETARKLIDCAPKTFETAVDCLDRSLSAEFREQLVKPDGATMAHFGLGMFLRNNWGLWKGGELRTAMQGMGFRHPDDMSAAILGAEASRLRKVPFDVNAEIAKYAAYWNGTVADQQPKTEQGRDR